MIKKKILVVLGGNSRERQISLKTGKACIAAIKKLGHKIEIFDPKKKSFLDIKRSNSDIIFKPLPEDDPLQRRPIIKLAKKEFNWVPLINISKGLDLTIDYFKEEIKKI